MGLTMKNRIKNEKLTSGQHSRLKLNARTTAKPKRQKAGSKQGPTQTLKDSDLRYRSLFENMLNGFAYCKMIFDQGRPHDFIYLDVNSAFESLTGLKNVVGKKVSEVIPGIRETDPELFEIYGRVALTGNPERFETYVEALKMWFLISVYSPGKDYFVAVFDVITERKQAEEALRESQEHYRQIIETAQEGVWTIDAADRTTLANQHLADMLGYKVEEMIGKSVYEFMDEEGKAIAATSLENRRQGINQQLDFKFTRKDGSAVWVLMETSTLLDHNHQYMGALAMLTDITERKQAEETIRLSEERFRTLYENNTLGLYRTTPDGRILLANPSLVRMLGYTSFDDLRARNLEQEGFEPSYSRSQFLNVMEKQGEIQGLESAWERRDGSIIFVRESARATRSAEGKILYYDGTVEDITERKRAEEALQANEARYRGMFEDSPISLWEEDFSAVKQRLDILREGGITDFEDYFISHPEAVTECAALIKVVDINKATMKMFGANRKEDILKNLEEIFEGEPTEVLRDELINIAEGKTRFDWEGINKTVDGRLINIDLSWSIAPGHENSLSKVIVSIIDITERRQAEERLAEERNLLRTLIDHLPDRIYAMDIKGRKTLSNLADWRASGGKTIEDVIGKTDFDNYPHELAEGYWALDMATIESGEPIINYEERGLDAEGNEVSVLTTKVPLRDGQGNVVGLVGIGRDITERKQAEERIQQQLERLAALRAIDQVVTSSFDLHISLTMILNQVTRELGVDAADVLLLNSANLFLEYSAGVGFRTKAAEKASVRLGQNYAGRVALERQLIQISDLKDQPDDSPLKTHLAGENFVCYFGVPLVAKGIVKGVLEVHHRTPLEPDQEWLDFLNTLANQAAIAIDNANLFDNLQRSNIELTMAYDATIEGWSHAMDLRDRETEGHTLRVTEMTLELAGLFGIKDEDLVSIRRGALLHDIGKMGVPDAILLKPAALTEEEWVIMRKHPTLAYEMLSPIHYLKSAIDIPYCHHEKWDGTGYPRGLKGEQIPLPARIFAIVDVWDAVTSDRPYRKAWSKEKATEYLKSQAGRHFDPQIVRICRESGVFDRIARNRPAGYR